MRELLAIDPGANYFAWAYFRDAHLIECDKTTGNMQFRLLDYVLIEKPQVYRYGRGDPNDLVDVAIMCGRLAEMLRQSKVIDFVFPRTWKGQVPKSIHQTRIKLKMTAQELKLLPTRKDDLKDVLDAIGIGLWKLGRLNAKSK